MGDIDLDRLRKVISKLRAEKDLIERKRGNFNKISFRIIRKRDQEHFYFVEWNGRHRWEGAIFSKQEIEEKAKEHNELFDLLEKEMKSFDSTFKRSDN